MNIFRSFGSAVYETFIGSTVEPTYGTPLRPNSSNLRIPIGGPPPLPTAPVPPLPSLPPRLATAAVPPLPRPPPPRAPASPPSRAPQRGISASAVVEKGTPPGGPTSFFMPPPSVLNPTGPAAAPLMPKPTVIMPPPVVINAPPQVVMPKPVAINIPLPTNPLSRSVPVTTSSKGGPSASAKTTAQPYTATAAATARGKQVQGNAKQTRATGNQAPKQTNVAPSSVPGKAKVTPVGRGGGAPGSQQPKTPGSVAPTEQAATPPPTAPPPATPSITPPPTTTPTTPPPTPVPTTPPPNPLEEAAGATKRNVTLLCNFISRIPEKTSDPTWSTQREKFAQVLFTIFNKFDDCNTEYANTERLKGSSFWKTLWRGSEAIQGDPNFEENVKQVVESTVTTISNVKQSVLLEDFPMFICLYLRLFNEIGVLKDQEALAHKMLVAVKIVHNSVFTDMTDPVTRTNEIIAILRRILVQNQNLVSLLETLITSRLKLPATMLHIDCIHEFHLQMLLLVMHSLKEVRLNDDQVLRTWEIFCTEKYLPSLSFEQLSRIFNSRPTISNHVASSYPAQASLCVLEGAKRGILLNKTLGTPQPDVTVKENIPSLVYWICPGSFPLPVTDSSLKVLFFTL
ncbi:hypothetical protein Pelo_6685 [Pelomyxa schiedti]|nr:hypothetical protein Pelo_6685 [Pelomyxa schiedti]